MTAPDPRSTVRHDIAPPAPMLVAATAWRADLARPRRSPWPTAAAMTVIAAMLGVYVWTHTAMPNADAARVVPVREAVR